MPAPSLILHHYWRSSASYRARIALNLKGLDYAIEPVHLLEDGGQQHAEAYRLINPQSLVPTLVHDGNAIGQSLAILEYLDEVFPVHPLLPVEPLDRAWVRGIALYIASEGQPLMNLRVLQHLEHRHGFDNEAKSAWVRHWLAINFANVERQLAGSALSGAFAAGSAPGVVRSATGVENSSTREGRTQRRRLREINDRTWRRARGTSRAPARSCRGRDG